MNSTPLLNIIIAQKPIAIKLLPPVNKSHTPQGYTLSLIDSVEERAYRCVRIAGYGNGLSVETFDKDLPRLLFGCLRGGDVSLQSFPVMGIEKWSKIGTYLIIMPWCQ